MRSIRTAFRVASIIGMAAFTLTRLKFAKGEKADKIVTNFSKNLLKKLGVKINVHGTPANGGDKKVLFLANHLSYPDFFLFRSQFTCAAVASEDVGKWSFIGPIAKSQDTVFIPQPKADERLSGEEMEALRETTRKRFKHVLEDGRDVVFFPEGKMGDGTYLNKFRPTAFQLLNDNGVVNDNIITQPVSISIRRAGGKDIEDGVKDPNRDNYAWYKNIETRKQSDSLPGQVWKMVKNGLKKGHATELDITYHEPLVATEFSNHYDMCEASRNVICEGTNVSREIPLRPAQRQKLLQKA